MDQRIGRSTLLCPNPESSVLSDWPFITEQANKTKFTNILDACARNGTDDVFDEYIWLGTNPLEEDSDRFYFDGVKDRRSFPSSGDGISDGWEIHFGLDPLNRSNALLDLDDDGWDANRDGIISVDAARSLEALAVGEQLSTLEEFYVHLDDGNMVKSGMRSVELGAKEDTYTEYLLTAEAGSENISILHHDIRDMFDDGDYLWVGTKLGITVIDFESDMSTDYDLPQGHDLHDLILLDDHAVMVTENGVWISGKSDGMLEDILQWQYFPGRFTAGAELVAGGGDDYVIALGSDGFGSVFQINGASVSEYSIGNGIANAMNAGNATATSIVHVDVESGPTTLFIGTDVGMLSVETTSARDEAIPNWRFYFSTESTLVATDIEDLRTIGPEVNKNPATVNVLLADGPSGGQSQVVWIGTPSGLHRLDLLSGFLTHSGDYAHQGVDGATVDQANDINSIYSTGDEILVGSSWGLWSLNGGYAAVYGMTNQEWVPGMISAIAVHQVAGVDTIFVESGQDNSLIWNSWTLWQTIQMQTVC